mgnify:CR=1 FL=1
MARRRVWNLGSVGGRGYDLVLPVLRRRQLLLLGGTFLLIESDDNLRDENLPCEDAEEEAEAGGGGPGGCRGFFFRELEL